jgi:5'-nucleotidase (lipoprotein e(P4) family)
MHRIVFGFGLLAVLTTSSAAQRATQAKDVKYFRDSEEFALAARMIYRVAQRAVLARRDSLPRGQAWAVVSDADETGLDNSAYQLDLAAYGQPHDSALWHPFIRQRVSTAIPGAADFARAVHQAGGHMVWISDRSEALAADTRENLRKVGLWDDGDRLCLLGEDRAYTKAARRNEVLAGTGRCSFGVPMAVLAYIGDQQGDFPAAGERDADAGRESAFGTRLFIIPNPMYGRWETRVTRTLR